MSSKYILPVIALLILASAIYFSFGPDTPEKYVFLGVTFSMGGVEYQGYTVEGQNIIFEYTREGDAFSQAATPRVAQTGEKYKNVENVYVKVDTNGDVEYYKAEIFDETEEMVRYYVKEE
ncbi:hypothetical protein [Methanococcus maripaludis]|uniref:Uncharacterized protein n=1 Tax=Methanococcus maripaludis TaxID=39152 RepID=A0A2L1CC86_METMI|nr:hypothetical protein [Methanococcus maripaludis]AVB76975.1 hypothetical protein MMJJ_16040 [Methanococcus maripaludis]MBA2863487.1 hypothetical protein [Methanococcus maripaludis]MBB6496509.1 hypothetical protein [Methanococcus maripaludis]